VGEMLMGEGAHLDDDVSIARENKRGKLLGGEGDRGSKVRSEEGSRDICSEDV